MLIKVCGLKDKSNVEELLLKSSPDLLGMIFYEKSQRYIGHTPLSIDKNIPKVGVFVNASIQHIADMHQLFGFEFVQLHGDENIEYIFSLKEKINIRIIKVFRVIDRLDIEEMKPYQGLVEYILLDTQTEKYGGSGRQFDWDILSDYNLDTPFILSGGIDLYHAEELLIINRKHPNMAGVDINSKFEISPGLKDPERVARFINVIRENTSKVISYDRNR